MEISEKEEDGYYYYNNKFPYSLIEKFLTANYTNVEGWTKREFSFRVKNGVYYRHKYFKTVQELTDFVTKHAIIRIDIGAICSVNDELNTQIVYKELIFDIDIDQ